MVVMLRRRERSKATATSPKVVDRSHHLPAETPSTLGSYTIFFLMSTSLQILLVAQFRCGSQQN